MNLITLLTPTNLAQEREIFFANTRYDPQFEYDWTNHEVGVWLEKNSHYQSLYRHLIEQDYNGIVREAENLFQVQINDNYIQLARDIISIQPEIIALQSKDQIAKAFQQAFKYFGLSKYTFVIKDQHGFNFRPEPTKQKIVMSAHANLDYFSIAGEVRHELCHIIRYENGKFNRLLPQIGYLPTEEGLATYCHDYYENNAEPSLFQHAAEYAVTVVGLRGSLRDMIDYLLDLGFTLELAWQRAVRHKFGWIDTSQPGDIMKPAMYFHHQQHVKKLSGDEKCRLFIGKIPIDSLALYPRYTGIVELDALKNFFSLDCLCH